MRFWDASALLPLVASQRASESVSELLAADDDITVWWGAVVECHSAIARLEREDVMSADAADVARSGLERLADDWSEVPPSEPLRRSALRLLRLHRLRAGDALQAAAALSVAEQDPRALRAVCLDNRLTEALRREGFVVEVPGPAR